MTDGIGQHAQFLRTYRVFAKSSITPMGPGFATAAIATAAAVVLLLVVAYFLLPLVSPLLRAPAITARFTRESTEWLNFIFDQVASRMNEPAYLAHLASSLAWPRPGSVVIRSMGNAPTVPYVATLEMAHSDDISLLVPFQWSDGPSLDWAVGGRRLALEIDVRRVAGRALLSWLGEDPHTVALRFDRGLVLDVDVAVRIGPGIAFYATALPLIGPIVVGVLVLLIERGRYSFALPRPDPPQVADAS
jgi:hypothetical protein